MGVYIKGMEMPKTCGECRFSVDGWCYAIASNDDQPGYINPYEKAKWCPLIEVQSHGDLIDREYAIATACSGRIRTLPTTEDGEDWIRVNEVRESIKSAPTVIPADKDGEA